MTTNVTKSRRQFHWNCSSTDYRLIASKIYEFIDEHGESPKDHLPDLLEDILTNEKDAKAKRRAQYLSAILYEIHENQNKVHVPHTMGRMWKFIRHQRIMQATLQVAEVIENRNIDDAKILECERIFEDAIAANERTRPELGKLASDIEPEVPDFLWYPYFVVGELNLVGGLGDVGKGQLLASIAARASKRARLWPDQSEKWPGKPAKSAKSCNVLWAEAEDSFAKTVIPRLMANGALRDRIHTFTREEFEALALNPRRLRRYINKHKIGLVVLSPLNSFLKLKTTNDEMAVRDKLQRLREVLEGTDCTIIAIVHLNKKTDLDAIERLLGSVAYANFSRSVCLVSYDEKDGTRRLVHAKHNLTVRGDDLLLGSR